MHSKPEIPKTYDPLIVEDKWYAYWMKEGLFKSVPDEREAYTVVIPPPNVTGVLHMGHMLNNSIQDILVRRARMLGKNACWVPGTDHASIATEAKVVALLKEKGVNKTDLTRDEFLKHAWDWKEKYGGIILEQLKKLGASCDWDRTKFTMDESLTDSVIAVFVDLFQKGYIYRGVRMVNWDPAGLTAVSDEEVNHKEVNSKLFYVRYRIEGAEDEWITIATTRPETILGDTAVCVHPADERYAHLRGKRVVIPIVNRSVPIIFDEYIQMEFGTGALKVTPAHDINDYELGLKHGLEVIDTLNPNGTISEAAGFYIGEDRFAVRKKIAKDLDDLGLMVKVEEIKNKVGYSERTDAVIEPRISMQWFLKMDQISIPALEHVMNDDIKIIPEKYKNTYRNWMENVHDWCISRQLWWGQRIPAYYLPDGGFVVAKDIHEALVLAKEKLGDPSLTAADLRQDEDVLDTWFSSWLWPISVFDGIRNPGNADMNYYYPTQDLVTAPEILFFWVARMIIAGYEYLNEKPFSTVYLTGIVRDKQGRKMSKQLGNSPDPIDLIHKYSADGVRIGMLLCSPAGNDVLFDEGLCEQGRNFANKLWNSFRLLNSWTIDNTLSQPEDNRLAGIWFSARLKTAVEILNDHYQKYRISDALMTGYKLVWDDFCSWYLEMIKPEYGMPIDPKTYEQVLGNLEVICRILHPFMPFITEEIWHLIAERGEKESIMKASWPVYDAFTHEESTLLVSFETAMQVITAVRNTRNEKNIPLKTTLSLFVKAKPGDVLNPFYGLVSKLCHLEGVQMTAGKMDGAVSFVVKADEYYIPLAGKLDAEEEIKKLNQELIYSNGFRESVLKKLNNEKFVSNAKPEVIDFERKKLADAEARIQVLTEQLASFGK